MIREAIANDIASLSMLMNQLGYPTTTDQMASRLMRINRNPDYWTYVFEQDNSIIGMIGLELGHPYEQDHDYIRILALVVDSNYRKQGIAKRLILKVEDLAQQLNINKIVLNSGNRVERKQAHDFYRRIGFEIKSSGFVKHLD